jgi:hypothetical protein
MLTYTYKPMYIQHIDTDCTARYNSNFHTYTTMKIPIIPVVSSLDNGKSIICGILYIAIADLNQLCFLLCLIYLISDCVPVLLTTHYDVTMNVLNSKRVYANIHVQAHVHSTHVHFSRQNKIYQNK